ncbi:MAG: bifunctional precorrin-2 dehydrogenase/sirohydrochlorin ferrochelatase [Leptotrichiaceae bacterium]|nr:bifunctional precorrin-2 dehydrogenase/sirohydrochlorin ferrochelatase [Leptotrichiaceae bacterium]
MFFPLYIDLRNKEVLIVGGGKLSSRKANKLVEYGANLTIYSEKIIEEKLYEIENSKFILENLENSEEKIEKVVKKYFLVIAATDDLELNDKIAHICMKNNILINNVSSKTEMNAIFGAIVKNDEFHVAISTYGKSCKRSKALKSRIEKVINEIEDLSK